jgi:hypothetical protein
MMFQVSEDDLAAMEGALALIFREGVDWPSLNDRPDIKEAWTMTIKTLSDIRFSGGPPDEAHVQEGK